MREVNLLVDLDEEGLPEKELPDSAFPQGNEFEKKLVDIRRTRKVIALGDSSRKVSQ